MKKIKIYTKDGDFKSKNRFEHPPHIQITRIELIDENSRTVFEIDTSEAGNKTEIQYNGRGEKVYIVTPKPTK